MAISASVLTEGGSNVDATTFTTASVSPANPVLAFVDISRTDSTAPSAPSLSGAGLTWSLVASVVYKASGTTQLLLGCYKGIGSGATGTILIDGGGPTFGGCRWCFIELAGAHVTVPVVQSVTNFNNVGSGIAISASLPSTATDANNRSFAGIGYNASSLGYDPRTAWTELSDLQQGSPSEGIEVQWRSDAFDQGGSGTNMSAGAINTGIILVEIGIAAAGGGGPSGNAGLLSLLGVGG